MDRQGHARTVTVRVTHQGQISLPLLGEVDAKGLTVSALEKTAAGRLMTSIFTIRKSAF